MSFEIRAATSADVDACFALAAHLDSVNLPHDRAEISELLARSEASFRQEITDPRLRQYVFLLRDQENDVAVGTSMILGQKGTREAPYIFFDVRREERYSATLDRLFMHEILSIGFSYHGPTEIGGLVVHPDFRRDPLRLGRMISYVRFLFLAMHREEFQDRVLAELMPPLTEDGRSHLWEAVGRHFTNLTYRDADRLSKRNKEFIRGLFPRGDIYISLLSPEAQGVIGEVGPATKGVEKMLSRIGFRYWNRVDPFDGGPHYIAPTDEIELVARSRTRATVAEGVEGGDRPCLVAADQRDAPFFRAVQTKARVELVDNAVGLDIAAQTALGVQPGDAVAVLALTPPTRAGRGTGGIR